MKILKRTGAILLCLCLLLAALPGALSAEDEERVLRVGAAAGQRGETVTLEVTLSAADGIAGGGFNLVYDPAVLTLVSAAAGEAMAGQLCMINPHYNETTIRVSFSGTAPLAKAGTVLTVTFRIRADAALGDSTVKAENVRFYGVDGQSVSGSGEDGAVTVQCVSMALTKAECLAGQSVKLEVLLDGSLAPCGGEFELRWDPKKLTAGSVKQEAKLGGTAFSLSAGIDNETGVLKVSWAATEPAPPPGKLCTVIFQTAEDASGSLAVGFGSVKFFNAEGKHMDYAPPADGEVRIISEYNDFPTLYMVGGLLNDETKEATVLLAVDGAGVVCGGKFRFSFDAEQVTLLEMTRKMGCVAVNPETPEGGESSFLVSWAEDSPALDNEAVLELRFRLKGDVPAPLTIGEAMLKNAEGRNMVLEDAEGKTQDLFAVHSGMIGVRCGLQAPVYSVETEEDAATVNAVLYDAKYCTETQTEKVRAVLAGYSGGKLLRIELPEDAIAFDEFGVAHLKLDAELPENVDSLRVFFVNDAGSFIPMCTTIEIGHN